ncbi:MAG: NAD(P)-dependent alcohol dehydrogenase [Desulfobacteraceae bacterium]|nr:NAD(P)-dependent alcohol dehydrogenase [Desulfobacteraceae bacterium]
MKAIVFQKYGSPDFLELKRVEKPVPEDNEVLIKIHAASINEWDWAILHGTPFVNRLSYGLFKPRMQILGADVAGRIEAVGKNVKRFQPDDDVFGDLCRSGWGGFAEYVCARENALTPKPASMTYEQAASLPQAGLLAVQGLRKGKIQSNKNTHQQKVLINGASGGVGTIAVQIAKLYGAEVTGVCSTSKMDLVRSFGADHVIDYKHEDFTKNGLSYDLILDVMGFHSIFDYKHSLNPSGRYVMIGGATRLVNQLFLLGPWISITSSKKMGLLMHKANRELDSLIELVDSGKVTPVIDRTYPLNKIADAFRYYGEKQARGKIVITVD